MAQILDGDANVGLPKGLITLAEEYMEINDWDDDQIQTVMQALSFLSARASGRVPTGAAFMRWFVNAHRDYKQDSSINQNVKFDLLELVSKLGEPANPFLRLFLKEFA